MSTPSLCRGMVRSANQQHKENPMRKHLLAIAALSLLAVSIASAQQVPTPTVTFGATASMPSLKDDKLKDTFTVTLTDQQVAAQLELTCQAGRSNLIVFRSDRACAVTGSGSIINPTSQQKLPRTKYVGGFITKADGATDGTTLSVNYMALGKVPPSATPFSGSLNLKPELTSSGAAGLASSVLKKIGADNSGGLIDQRVDTVDLNRLFIPSAGFPSDKGCVWSGNMVFAYQTSSWFLNITANCDGRDYAFKGNMPWTDSPGVESQTQYDLTLTLPSAELAGDDAMFASTGDNGDLFATVDGITGQIIMKEANRVTVQIDGVATSTPSLVEATGKLTGTNVPLDTVRSLGVLLGLLSSNLFGA